jgi:hypothetical protein
MAAMSSADTPCRCSAQPAQRPVQDDVLAFKAAGARDWSSNLAIALDHSGTRHRLQFHHIFPKTLLRRSGKSAREADDIANLAFIGGKTNRTISDEPSSDPWSLGSERLCQVFTQRG